MQMVKCNVVGNHFYDADKYASCPHCARLGNEPMEQVSTNQAEAEEKKGLKDLFKFKPRHRTVSYNGSYDATQSIYENETELLPNTSRIETNADAESLPEKLPMQDEVHEPSVSQQIRKVAMSANISDIKTVAFYGETLQNAPVVGWLAVLNTMERGNAFELTYGKNSIGRSGTGNPVDISLDSDPTVSRGAQAIVIYEPKKRKFLIQATNGSTLVYVNDELLMTHTEIFAYDKVTIGETELLFIPLCSDRFSWDET